MSNSPERLPLRQRKPLRISTDLSLFARPCSDSSSSPSSPTNQNVTPVTTPSTGTPQYFFHVLCMYDFESLDPTHLPFLKFEMLIIIKKEPSGWWAAMRPHEDRIGWIPSSFVLPLNKDKMVEYSEEALSLWSFESLNDPPLSAVHDPWVPVSEDCSALSFRLVTPTDPIPYKGFLDDRARYHDFEPFFSLPVDEKFTGTKNVNRVYLQKPFIPESRASSSLDVLHHHRHPCKRGDDASLRCLATSVGSNETSSELISSSDIGDSLVVIPGNNTHFGDGIGCQLQHAAISIPTLPADPDQDIVYIGLLDLAPRDPDRLSEQLCVLMHTLYATIRQDDCLDWIVGRKNTEVTGLQHLFVFHDYIASWVQQSILACGDITRQAETLGFWIRVAEKCHVLHNFDSLYAIISSLSGSSLGSARARLAHNEILVTLYNALVVANKYSHLIDIMDAAEGPFVPFVRGYLEHIKELHADHSLPCQSGHVTDTSSSVLCEMQLAAVSTLLRYQSSPYDFKITKSVRDIIDGRLRTDSQ